VTIASRSRPPDARQTVANIAGDYYSKLVDAQLVEERSRKASLEQRAGGVITTSGAVVTLIFAFTSLIKGSNVSHVPDAARIELMAALAFLLMAVVLALVIGFPRKYEEVDEASLKDHVAKSEWMNSDVAEAHRLMAEVIVGIITTARGYNDDKANLLFWAVALEVVGIVALALSAMSVALS
jgi:choline-glycine betaine transporter